MQKIFNFLDSHIEVALATVGDNKPHIRMFQIMKRVDDTLFFATAPHKRVYAELQGNPNVEIMASNGNIFVRIAGTAMFDVDDATQRAIFNDNAVLPRLYENYNKLVYFKIEAQEAQYFDLTPTPPINEYHDLKHSQTQA